MQTNGALNHHFADVQTCRRAIAIESPLCQRPHSDKSCLASCDRQALAGVPIWYQPRLLLAHLKRLPWSIDRPSWKGSRTGEWWGPLSYLPICLSACLHVCMSACLHVCGVTAQGCWLMLSGRCGPTHNRLRRFPIHQRILPPPSTAREGVPKGVVANIARVRSSQHSDRTSGDSAFGCKFP